MPLPTSAPTLTDGVVTLRAHAPADADSVLAMARDPETRRWTSIPDPYRPDDARRWIEEKAPQDWRSGVAFRWAVEADGRFAGNLDVSPGPPPSVGFGLAPAARGRGVMSAALRLAARWAFHEARLPVLHWWAQAGNLASWRVAHACGFRHEGTRRLAVARRGELRDGWFASLAAGDALSPRTTWWPTPVLTGERVRLRPHTAADLPRIVQACSDPRTRRWLPGLPHPYTEQEAQEFVLAARLGESLGRSVTWAVAHPDDDRLLANVSVFALDDTINPTSGEVGYWAHPDARGRGVVGEALDLVVAHAFTPVTAGGLGRHRLQIGAAWSNTASRHVAERAGFRLAGRFTRDGVVGVGADRAIEDGAWYELLV
ncbi:GNAT family N-acetyltransferase [Pseudonocardia sp. MH-G8]|uniref:GNAT family N-acetyltransferase n=1 Tax=Pseudonocardia sp. MH-G8 TaxID=1854588 RepID=UPI000B9FCD04|nr:GNAT family N-acetyltransferase [Pseudonocardia sp. MH-G8]OZM78666.1 GNAT family N-acetyltransferase [Pseudonocardia sp. MH-G8]